MATMGRALGLLIAVATLVALATPATAQPLYSITDLGALPDTTAVCLASSLNDLGTVTGTCVAASFNEVAFVWQNGVMTSLGKLPRANYSVAHGINERGTIVGEGDTGDYRPDPTLYRDGQVINIDSSGGNARAIHITESGVIVGDYSKGFGNVSSWSPVIWTERADRPGRFDRLHLAPYPGGDSKARYGYALGANDAVQVVGYVQNTLFGQKGAFWDNDANHTLSLLEPLPGHWSSVAHAVNGVGQAVGESRPPFRVRAVLWLADATHTPVDLGTLPGDVDSTATAINDLGQVLGYSVAADGTARPFLWQNGQMLEVASLLDASGVDWVLQNVRAINNRGQLVGTGLYRGELRSFLMTPAGQ